MARIKIAHPDNFSFSTTLPVRITDINYGGHLGNDAILSLVHEARVQFLSSLGYSEMNVEGCGLIMADVAVEFKSEAFYGDLLKVSVTATDMSRVGFDLVYKLEKAGMQDAVVIAIAKTGMICFNYEARKVMALPVEALAKLNTTL